MSGKMVFIVLKETQIGQSNQPYYNIGRKAYNVSVILFANLYR